MIESKAMLSMEEDQVFDTRRRNFFGIIPHLHGGTRISSYKDDDKSLCLGNCQAFWKEERFNVEYGPGDHWWALLKKRHSSFALRKADSLE